MTTTSRMGTTTLPTNNQIRHEADRILGSGLLALLRQHGEPHIVGSYELGLMTWRDLDVLEDLRDTKRIESCDGERR